MIYGSINILVVDDDQIIRKLLADVFIADGYEVTCVINGREALQALKEKNFTLVFSDVHMPELNGLETLRSIHAQNPNLPVVMMDSFPDELLWEAQREGALTCIHKPFDLKELRDIVKKILKGEYKEMEVDF